jgi:molybdopterin-guanine dinucleotide biosynthesis protein A
MTELLFAHAAGYDVAVPRKGTYLEPLFAVYHRNCLLAIEKWLAAGNNKTDGFYKDVSVNYLDVEKYSEMDWDRSFFNVNTPGDWQLAGEMAARRGGKPPQSNA